MKTFDQFKADWLGKFVDYDHVYKFQCVDLILQGLYEMYGITGVSGNAIWYWTRPSEPLKQNFDRIDVPEKGAIAVFKTKGYYGSPDSDPGDGHIGWATGQYNGTQMEILEQNGQTGSGSGTGGDAVRLRWIDRDRLAGLWRHKAPLPASYTVTATYTPGKQVRLNKDPTNLWGMNYHFDYMKDHPVEVHPYGEIITVTNKVHHEDGYDYYRCEGQIDGFNVLDCDDYTPSPPKPPAPPVVVAKAEKYQLVTDLLCFASPIDAAMNTTPTGELKAGSYYVWNRDKNMLNLTSDNMKDQNQWVDPNRNVVPVVEPPKPAPQPMPETKPLSDVSVLPDETWKVTHPLFEDGEPITLTSINTMEIPIKALDGKLPETLPLPAHKELQISHYFVYKGVLYYQDVTLHDNIRFYALPAGMFPDPYKALDINHDGDVTISDFIDYGMKVGKRVFISGTAVINTALKSIKTKKFIDGVKSNIQSERVQK